MMGDIKIIFNLIKVLESSFALALALELVKTKAEFSEKLLGRGSSYLSSMSARDRCPSRDVLLTLERKLLTLLDAHKGTTPYGMDHAPITTQFYARLERVYRYVNAAHLVHESFADGFYPANQNDSPPRQTAAQIIAFGYCAPDVNVEIEQLKLLEARG